MSTESHSNPDQQGPQVPKSSEDYQGMAESALPEMQTVNREELDGEPTLPAVPAVQQEVSAGPIDNLDEVRGAESNTASVATEQANNDIPEFAPVVRTRPEVKKPSLGRKIAAGGATILALVGIGAGAKHLTESESVVNKNSHETILDSDKPVSEQKIITSTTTTEAPVTEEPVVGEAGNPLVRSSENGETNEVSPGSEKVISEVTPGTDDKQPVVGESEANNGPESVNNTEATVQEAVMLTDFLMGNQVLTGLNPTIELGDNGTGTLVFSEPEFTVSVNGLMEEGIIKQDPLDQLKGFNAIEITVQGERVEIRVDKDTQQPALNVTTAEKTASTNAKVFPGEVDENFASTNSRKIIDQLSVFVQNLKMQ